MKKKQLLSRLVEKIKVLYKKNKKVLIAGCTCFVILLALIFSTFSDISKNKQKTKNIIASNTISVTSFAKDVESKLTEMIIKLDSVTTVSVFVMVQATPTITYLTETTEKTETKESGSISEKTTTVVFEKNGSISTPVVVTTIMPKVTGVLIVTNNISSSTKLSIINSVSIVLNIDKSCISLLQES